MSAVSVLKKERAWRRAVFAAVCAAFLFFGWVLLGGIGLERSLLHPPFYDTLMDELEIPGRLRAYFLERLRQAEIHPLIPDSLLQRAAEKVITAEWLREQGSLLAAEMIAYVRGESGRLVVAVELQSRKEIFKQELIASLSLEKLERLGLTGVFVEEFLDSLELPQRLVLAEISEEPGPGAGEALQQIRRARIFYRFVPWIVLLLLAGLCFAWSGAAGGLQWTGGAMLAGGLSYLLLLPAVTGRLAAVLAGILSEHESLGPFLSENPGLVEAAAQSMRPCLAGPAYIYAGAGLVLLAAGLAAGRVLKGK